MISDIFDDQLPPQQCQGWAHSPTPVYQGLKRAAQRWVADLVHWFSAKKGQKLRGQDVKTSIHFALPSRHRGLEGKELVSLSPCKHQGKAFCRKLRVSEYLLTVLFAGSADLLATTLQTPVIATYLSLPELGSWLSQGMYFGMVSSLRRISTVASPPNSCQNENNDRSQRLRGEPSHLQHLNTSTAAPSPQWLLCSTGRPQLPLELSFHPAFCRP